MTFFVFLSVGSATAASPSPGWTIDSVAAPTNFPANVGGAYHVEVMNAGSQPSTEASGAGGVPITVTDTVPEGLTVHAVLLFKAGEGVSGEEEEQDKASLCETAGRSVICRFAGVLAADQLLKLIVHVSVNNPNAAGPLTNSITVSGGGAPEASASANNEIASTPPSFGPANFNFYIGGVDGNRDTQAGGHPYELTTTIDLHSAVETGKELNPVVSSVEDPRDIVVDLPLGFVASELAAPQCTLAQLSSQERCPKDTIIGHIRSEPDGTGGEGKSTTAANSPIWNLTPERGAPAEFGFIDGTPNPHVFYAHVVPTPTGYVLQSTASELPQIPLSHIVVSFFGEPALRNGSGNTPIPFFTNPTACDGGSLKTTIYMDSWQHPGGNNPDGTPDLAGDPAWVKMTSESPPVTGCAELRFTPELIAQPTTFQADSPSGLDFELKVPQSEEPQAHATPALKNATVSLPEGMTADPSSANGLQACSAAQIGWLGADGPNGESEPLPNKGVTNFNQVPPECPEASKIGSLELQTPLIAGTLTGAMYLAAQNENPFGSVLATYVVVNDPTTGVVLKISGEIKANPATGQLTTYFPENAQLPFSDLGLHFFGGPRAELATPESCGTFTTSSVLEPWSAPDSGPDAMPFDSFLISEGCVNGFAPSFTGGSENTQAGAFAPFVLSLSRADTDQELAGLTVTAPPGLSAILASVTLCPEAQANAGTCSEASRIGTVTVGAGPGPNPLFVTGKVFLTGPYKGAPFGDSVVVPAVAGPFNFGTTVVRGAVFVDPHTAQVITVSDPFPRILDPVGANGATAGIPIRVRRVDVRLDREHFIFNPTNCEELQLGSTLTSTQKASASFATPFQMNNCAKLRFTPKVSVSTPGRTTKANGTSLFFKVAYPKGALGTQSWMKEMKFSIPKQLPARLTTIQKACLAQTFETNRSACPAASIIGHVVVHTPVLPVPLEGPLYFVSYGGAAFPDAVAVLHGYGLTIESHGKTFIDSKSGVTSATFESVPDVPFESIEVSVPQGPFSEFGANLPKGSLNFCGQKLVMPILFKAQNGLEIRQSIKINITGCAKPPTRAQLYKAALKKCRKHDKHNKARRQQCEKSARKRYGPVRKGNKR